MSRTAKWTLGILGYLMMGALTAQISTAVVGPADALSNHTSANNTAARSVIVAIGWPIALPIYVFIAAGKP